MTSLICYGKGKVAYLSTTKNPFTMQIPSYQLSESLALPFDIDTVHLIKDNHTYELSIDALFHTDQGCHYTSNEFRELIKLEGFIQYVKKGELLGQCTSRKLLWAYERRIAFRTYYNIRGKNKT